MIFSLFRDGIEDANRIYKEKHPDSVSSLENVVLGRLLFIGMVKGQDSSVYIGLARSFNHLPLKMEAPTHKQHSREENIDERLSFGDKYSRNRLVATSWVTECEVGVDTFQGSAFMLSDNRLVTCNHVFHKAGLRSLLEKECVVYRINEPGKKYIARTLKFCKHRDMALLELQTDRNIVFPSLNLGQYDIHSGFKVSLTGFPQKLPGHKWVTCIPTMITNNVAIGGVDQYEVGYNIQGGNSGGAALDANMNVIGMARQGQHVTIYGDPDGGQAGNDLKAEQAGNNLIVAAKEIVKFLAEFDAEKEALQQQED